jgi:hypothetical protein
MKRFNALLLMAVGCVTAAMAQWNTNATPKLLFGLEYTDPITGEVKTGGDYYACNPKAVRTPDKKTWISWKTSRTLMVNDDIHSGECTYLQLLDINGVPQFDEPILINDHVTPSWWSEYALCVASDGSAIVTVADSRTEEENLTNEERSGKSFTPAIYKIDQEGNFLWGLDGVEYRNIVNGPYTNAFVVGDDTYFIFMELSGDNTSGVTYLQRIDAEGMVAWDEPKVLREEPFMQYFILPSTDGDFLLFDHTAEGARVQRLNRDWEDQWGGPITYDEFKYDGYAMNSYKIVSDGNGGACVAFVRPMGGFTHNIRVQHINADGSLGFGLTGLDAANTVDNDYDYCGIAVNPETEEILVDFESQLPSTYDVMLQKFSFDGDYLFDELGLSIAAKNSATNAYAFGPVGCGAIPGTSDWIVIYRDVQNYVNSSFIIRRYDKDGNRLWSRTIGREIDPTNTKFFVEKEATYLIYRETRSTKEPGIKIFRIGNDGTYNVTYEGIGTGITETQIMRHGDSDTFFSIDGKQLRQPQRGLNIVRRSDGSIVKQIR